MTAQKCFTLITTIKVFDKFKLRAAVFKHALHLPVVTVCWSVSVQVYELQLFATLFADTL